MEVLLLPCQYGAQMVIPKRKIDIIYLDLGVTNYIPRDDQIRRIGLTFAFGGELWLSFGVVLSKEETLKVYFFGLDR